MSAAPGAPTGGADPPLSKTSQMLRNCWSCRIISGGGLILSGAYVYNASRRVLRQGGPTTMGTVAQISFAACLAAWGLVVITDPVGKAIRKA